MVSLPNKIKVKGKYYERFHLPSRPTIGFLNKEAAAKFCSRLRTEGNLNCQFKQFSGEYFVYVRPKKQSKSHKMHPHFWRVD